MKFKVGIAALFLGTAPLQAAEPLHVLATIGMIGDLAEQVGGSCTSVETLIGAGADPHLFTPAPSDLKKLQRAEAVLYGGLHLEGQLGEVLARLARNRPVVAVSEAALGPEQLMSAGDLPDPHVWMDISLWRQIVPVIAELISQERPACATEVAANAAKVEAELEALDLWAKRSIASIPERQRHLITAHDAFGYFGRAYGIEVSAIQGISTQSEAAIADIEEVAALVAQSGVPSVFVESTINPRTIEALTEAVAAKGASVAIGGELFADSMGAKGSPEGSYAGMMRHNIETITKGLGGMPPALGN